MTIDDRPLLAVPPFAEEVGTRDACVLVLVHTHWDREWYRTADEFRPALVALIDEVLDGRAGEQFLLDGQAIVVQDYLGVRPQRRDALVRALRDGGVEAGPWYVLGDTLIPSGEALVRNLLAGRAAVRALGAAPPRVLYCPDTFGHAAALPVLAAGFGAPVLVAWRGVGGARAPAGDVFRWRHAGGDEALLFHLPRDGYEFGSSLPADPADAATRWESVRDGLLPRSTLGILLVQNGADHHAVQDRLEEALAGLRLAAAPLPVDRTTLDAFAQRLRARASNVCLPVVAGELRDSTGHTWSLQGTLGARASQKRTNAQLERRLTRDVEPWAALARWGGGRSWAPDVDATWRRLLECHPHDTLCGCSVDAVAQAMDDRLRAVHLGALHLGAESRLALLGHRRDEAREAPGRWRHVVLLRNPAPRARGGVGEIEVEIPLADVPVGPGSAGFTLDVGEPESFALGDGEVALQLLDSRRDFSRVESPRHYPRNALVERRRYLAWLPPIAPYSVRGLAAAATPAGRRRPASVVRVERGALRSDALRLEVVKGEVCLTSDNGRTIRSLIAFADEGERGDLYTHSAIPGTATIGRFRGQRVTMRGPLRAELVTRWDVPVAPREVVGATGTRVVHPPDTIRVEVRFQLDAGTRFVRVVVRGENDAPDHRLRLVVRSGIGQPMVCADAAFGEVQRLTSDAIPDGDATEAMVPTAPLHRYVTCYGAGEGVTLFSDGLAEHEVRGDGSIAVTLVRATGDLSRHDLPERPGHAGWPAAVPLAQQRGPFEGCFALLMHGGRTDAVVDEIERTADDVLLPLVGDSLRSALRLPAPSVPLALEGEGLAFSACKDGEDGRALVLRCVNRLARPVDGAWRLSGIHEAQLARLDETPLGDLPLDGDRVRFVAPPHAVVTIIVRGGAPAGPNDEP